MFYFFILTLEIHVCVTKSNNVLYLTVRSKMILLAQKNFFLHGLNS